MKRRRRFGLSPVERAFVAQRWEKGALDAQLHALIGEDSDAMVNAAGRVFFVVLTAAAAAGLHSDDGRVVTLLDAIDGVHDQAGEGEIPQERRERVIAGLHACGEICPELTQRQISDAALEMEVRLARQDVRLSDFRVLADRLAA